MQKRLFCFLFFCTFLLLSATLVGAADIGMNHSSASVSMPIRFAIVSDYGDADADSGDVAGLINGWSPEFVISAGDNRVGATNYDRTVGQFYCRYLKDCGSGVYCSGGNGLLNAFFPSAGNHDYTDGAGINEYLSYFDLAGAGITTSGTSGNERYYDFVKGPVHFFVIDSYGAMNDPAAMTAQKSWLQTQLAASTTAWQVVYFHHPPFCSSSGHGSTPAMQWPFAAWGADAVISGHNHVYERILSDGIVYFVDGLGGQSIHGFGTPVAGSEVRYNVAYGAMLADATDSEITFRFVSITGSVIDEYTVLPPPPGVLDIRVMQSSDDVEERLADGSMYLTSTDLELGNDPTCSGDQIEGLRFQNIKIPQGARILSAYLEFETDEVGSGTTAVTIKAQNADNAPGFTTAAYDLTGRPTTTAFVAWDIPAWNTVDERHRSPDLAPVIQELVDRPGWVPSNSMVFVISGSGTRTAEAYDGEPGAAPLLHVAFDAGSVNNAPAFTSDPLAGVEATEDTAYHGTLAGGAADADGDSLTFAKADGPDWLTVGADGVLSGTPAKSDIGANSWTVQVNDGRGGSDRATLQITVAALPRFIDQTATGEISIDGLVAVSYLDTQLNDSITESITERATGGSPKSRQSLLEHKWLFDVQPGFALTLFVNAWATASSDGDTFMFSYSADDVNYFDMFAIGAGDDSGAYKDYAMPNNLAGTVYIRVMDTDRTRGNVSRDTLLIDHLFIRTDLMPGEPPLAPTGLTAGAASGTRIDLSWTNSANNELGFYVERSFNGSEWALAGTAVVDAAGYADTGLTPGTAYYYRVRAYNSAGVSGYSNIADATTNAAVMMHVSGLDGVSSFAGKRWNATVRITVQDAAGNDVPGALVTGSWSNGVSGSSSCATNAIGQCSVTLTNIRTNVSSVIFTISNLEHASYTHDPGSDSAVSITTEKLL